MPHDSEQVATFARADESALLHCLDDLAIGRQRAYTGRFRFYLLPYHQGLRLYCHMAHRSHSHSTDQNVEWL